VRLVIDYERCTGHGRCFSLQPALFTDDENGYGHVIDDGEVPADKLENAQRAIRACPEQSISLVP
jgi:ferredoxin